MAVKLAKAKKKQENTGKLVVTGFLEYLCVLWTIVMAFVLTLYMKDNYYQIGAAKFKAFAAIVIFAAPVFLLLAVLYVIFVRKEKTKIKTFSATDWFALTYLGIVLLSSFCSGHLKQAFWGYNGWYMGLFAQLAFVGMYFLFSRFLKDSQVTLFAVCAAAFYAYVIGILHRLLIDVIGTYEGLNDYYKTQFLSTLGQASWYSSFMTTILPVGMFAFWHARHKALRVLSGIFVQVGFMTLVTQNTDSAYFGFLAAMLVLLHVSVKDAGKLRRWFEIAFLFVLAPKIMYVLLKIHPNEVMNWDAISHMLVYGNWVWILAVLCLTAIGICLFWDKKATYPKKAIVMLRNGFYAVLLLLVIVWIALLVASAKGWAPAGIAALSEKIPYLQWNKEWGNGRGFTWGFTAEILGEMNLKNRLIGVGPDCFAIYAHGNYNEVIQSKWGGMVLTNAHNEWLNSFVNVGILGGIAYLGIFLSALVRFVRNSENRPLCVGMAACIAAYTAHNIFCYQQVLCTPFVFLFLAIGEYQMRKKVE